MRYVSQFAIAAAFATLLAAPVLAHETGTPHSEAMTPTNAGVSLPTVKGEVVKIDDAAGKMTIKHDAIPNLGMDPMTMVFKGSDPAMLKSVKVGDKVNFQADKLNGQLTVMKIEKGK